MLRHPAHHHPGVSTHVPRYCTVSSDVVGHKHAPSRAWSQSETRSGLPESFELSSAAVCSASKARHLSAAVCISSCSRSWMCCTFGRVRVVRVLRWHPPRGHHHAPPPTITPPRCVYMYTAIAQTAQTSWDTNAHTAPHPTARANHSHVVLRAFAPSSAEEAAIAGREAAG